ncbi:Ger(x)C family spore germination protein [Sporosarcina sp. resist]|uniref:Ger(x)C family spore germination protein n=1 Tax=Sporosarcina TaxID=1569 RepID=UPI00078B33A1|nr:MULTISPECIES: Ger(x)C family spore germination protein [Sporosarcina]AMQ07004.1 spore gernimation protein GerC [Sporosarcina psychrophila]QNK86709.1 Ger(x)C family spore germination protein [Sporosarcina sp. resist]
MKKYTFVLLILSLVLTGCWDRRELNEIAITLALGIDKVDEEFQLTAQVVVPSEVSMKQSSGRSTVTLFQATGETIFEAFRKMTIDSPRKIYPGHLRMLVIGEELAKAGVGESLDLLSRDWELRSDFYVVVAKDKTAAEILNVTTPIESIPANKMFNTLKTSEENWAVTKGVTLDELLGDFITDGKDAVLTGIQVFGNQEVGSSKQNVESITPAAQIQYDYLAVFRQDKLVGWLNESESKGYNYIIDSVKSTVASISCPEEGKVSIEVINSKSELKGKINKGEPEVNVTIEVEGNVGEVECHIDMKDTKTIDALEKSYEKELKEIVHQTIETLQKQYNSDIFGFGQAIHRSNPKTWKKIKNQWDEEFTELTVNVEVDMKIRDTGTVSNSFLQKLEE